MYPAVLKVIPKENYHIEIYYENGEVINPTVLFTKDNKIEDMACFLKETDNALEVLDKALLNYVIETIKNDISSRKDAVEEL